MYERENIKKLKYDLIKKNVGKGGQSWIDLIQDCETRMFYSKKVFKNKKRIKRLYNEIESITSLDNYNIIKIIDYDLYDQHPYYIMDYYAEGHLKKKHIGKFSIEKKMDFILKICKAISYSHGEGIIHRDIKPSNILLKDDEPILSDFGLSFNINDNNRETREDERVGSYFYMAPELEDGRHDVINETVDIYSLGKVIYWIFSNGKIFNREKLYDAEYSLLNQNMNYLFSLRIMIVIYYAISTNLNERYKNANELIQDLENSILYMDSEKYLEKENRFNEYIPKTELEERFIILYNLLIECIEYKLYSEHFSLIKSMLEETFEDIIKNEPQSPISNLSKAFSYFGWLDRYYESMEKIYGWDSLTNDYMNFMDDYSSFIDETKKFLGEIKENDI